MSKNKSLSIADLERIAERVLKLSHADETEVDIGATTDALTRFANNTIHQNVAEEILGISIRTVIEGVETSDQAIKVAELGCHGAQGFLYARPARADQVIDIIGLLKRWLPSALAPEKAGEELVPPTLEVVQGQAT